MNGRLYLASGSPRRAKILQSRGVAFRVLKTDAPEVSIPDDPEETVRANALAKLDAAQKVLAGDAAGILTADTIVWRDGRIYGKPRDLEEAKAFLRELGGRTHTVFTGVAYADAAGLRQVGVWRSDVTFRPLDEARIGAYVAQVKPTDRAGAYDIDEAGEMLVASYTGTYENIMGLPVEALVRFGLTAGKGE